MPIERKSAAIMFTDIAGYTQIMSESEQKALEMLRKKRSILKPLIDNHKGTYVKEIGDGTLSYFESGYNASSCAKDLQKEIKEEDLKVRVGIHIGDIVFDEDDVYGDGVNIASRLESLAPAGGVLISKNVYDELLNKDDFDGIPLGLQSLKGVGRLVEVYAIKDDYLVVPRKEDYKKTEVTVHKDDEVPSIAIIPFDNKGTDEDVFYAYGISADLISDCSGAGLIRVASLKDVEKLDYNNLGTSELSEKLLVRYIAQGTLWKMGDMFQLSIELYDTKDKKVVWSDRWQEKWENLSMIKGNLSDGLLQALSTKPKVAKKVDFTNTEAYEYYLKGKHKFHVRTNKEDIEIAVGFLQKSIILDEGLIEAKHIIAHAQPTLQENLKLMEAIIEEATKLGNKLALAKAYDSKGWFLWNLSKYELAENSFNNAISLFEELENRRGISGSLNGLGFVYLFLGQSNSALETWTMGIKIAEEIDDKEELHHLCMHLALFYISEEKYKEAKQLLDKSREYSGECNNETSKAIFLHVEGRIDFYKKDYDSASLSFKKSYEIVEKLNDKTNYIWSFSWYILTQIISGEINQENNLKLIHKRIEDGWLLDIDFPEVYHNLYRIYKALNDIDKANFYLDLAYNKVSELAEKIENTEYKESFFHSKWNSKLLADWKTFNKK